MRTPVFTGSCPALVTPFDDHGTINYDAFGKLIDAQIESGVDAVCVCGTTGESATMSIREHIAAVEFCVKRVDHRVKVIAGAGSNDTSAAVYLSQHAQDSGADALLHVTPYYNKASQTGLIKHYEYIADRTELPIILYNVPGRTGVSFTADTYKVLSANPKINGVKEASGNFSLLAHTRYLCPDDFYIWSGNDDQVVPMMALGAKGVISVASNIIPQVMVELHHDLGDDVAGHRDDPLGTQGHHRHHLVVVARPDVEVVGAEVAGVGQEGEVAAGLLHAVDLGVGGQHLVCIGGEGYAGAAGHVVEDDGQLGAVGDVFIVLDEAGLAGLVVVGGDMEQGVGSGVLGVLRQVDGGGGVVRARAGNHLYPVVHPLDAELHGGDVFPDGHGGRLAGGAADAHRVHAGFDLSVDQLAEGVVVDGAVVVKGGDQGGAGAGEDWSSHNEMHPFQ